jgi:hypothetical protein
VNYTLAAGRKEFGRERFVLAEAEIEVLETRPISLATFPLEIAHA